VEKKNAHGVLFAKHGKEREVLEDRLTRLGANTINITSRSSVIPTCFGIKFCHPHGVRLPNLELAFLGIFGEISCPLILSTQYLPPEGFKFGVRNP
jgi:hypothetical protein